jgi:3-dehydrosphinganine reductase
MRKADTTFKGKNVIVTGGSSGIGKATAKLLARSGSNVFIIARDQAKLDQALHEIEAEGNGIQQQFGAFSADVTSYEEVEDAIAAIVETSGAPDILINCAGMVYPGYFEELPLSTFREQMDVNFFGTLHTVKAVVPYMKERGSGHIANISSIGGAYGVFGYTAYSASKFAVFGFTEALRAELKPHNIGVSLVLPFDTDTPQLRGEKKIQPLETKVLTSAATLENISRPKEIIASWFVRLMIGDGKPDSADHVAKTLVRGIRRRQYAILPDPTLNVAYYLRGLIIPLANWAYDQLIPLAREQRGAGRFVERDPVACAPGSSAPNDGPDDLEGSQSAA